MSELTSRLSNLHDAYMENDGERDVGRTMHEALRLALEMWPGRLREWVVVNAHVEAMHDYLVSWINDYAKARGVLFDHQELEREVDQFIIVIKREYTPQL